jgi:hypothetical protein
VPPVIEVSGAIETVIGVPAVKVGDTLKLVFRAADDADPPFTCKVISPAGKVIVERVLRDLPTGKPQSAPPVTFVIAQAGEYRVDVWQLYGKVRGQALIRAEDAPPPG